VIEKLRRRWARHAALMGEMKNTYTIFGEKRIVKHHLRGIGVRGGSYGNAV
jgi:hypothetical protein